MTAPPASEADLNGQPAEPSPKPQLPGGRIVVVETACHQVTGEQPLAFESRYGRWLETDEQPFSRNVKVGESWLPLERGWIGSCSMLLVRNAEGRFDAVPTDEERAATEARVLELAVLISPPTDSGRTQHSSPLTPTVVVPIAAVPPGESGRFPWPPDLSIFRIRCRAGVAKAVVTMFPG